MDMPSLNDSARRRRFFIARIRGSGGLDEQKMNLFIGDRPVFDPFRHDTEDLGFTVLQRSASRTQVAIWAIERGLLATPAT